MADAPAGERTEQATEKRMKEVREKGQLSRSQDITAWVAVGVATIMLPATISRGSTAAVDQMFTVRDMIAHPDVTRAVPVLFAGLGSLASTLGPLFIAVVVGVFAASAAQGGIRFKKFRITGEHFNVINGLKGILGPQAWWNGVKSLLKTAVVGAVLYVVIQGIIPLLMQSGGLSVNALIGAAGKGITSLVEFAVAAGVLLAFADVFVVARRNRKKTRMTKKEVKDEHKSSEGDPHVKGQRRSRQMAMARNRMMSAVPDADVVLVNPTHVAVALRYEPGKSAPRVLAKGSGEVAARIRDVAEKAGVPMVKDIPLARALHGACDIGEEIPVELYNQVAAILAFVMALKKRGAAKGVHQLSAHGSDIPTAVSQAQA